MIQLTLLNAQAGVQQQPDGSRILILQDLDSGISVVCPFPEEAAKGIGGQLLSGVDVASEIPEVPAPPSFERAPA